MKTEITVDKQNIFYREPGNEYRASCRSSDNSWAHCVLEKDYTLTFIDGDRRCGGVVLSTEHYKHRNVIYWLAVEEFLNRLDEVHHSYYKDIIQMLIDNNAHIVITNNIATAQVLNK